MGREKVAVGGADMTARGCTRAAPQDPLIAHELAVVLAHQPSSRPESRVRNVWTRRPLPNISKHLLNALSFGWLGMKNRVLEKSTVRWHSHRRDLPFLFARKPCPPPSSISIGFEVADMANGLGRIDSFHFPVRKQPPLAVVLFPVERGHPTLSIDRVPACG